MVRTYQAAIACERLRQSVFAGERSPLVFGDPPPWLALMIQALNLTSQRHFQQANELRAAALEQAPATVGSLNGTAFHWVADADSRLGPVLEVLVNGKYYWMPIDRARRIVFEAPSDVRDLVWMPAQLTLANGGEVAALIPTRYPGSEAVDDAQIRMARRTDWQRIDDDTFLGLGQRILTTDALEVGLLELRELVLGDRADG
jgi:type VI secretion system protein ImpE